MSVTTTTLDCSLQLVGRFEPLNGVARLILFTEDNMEFWFGRINIDADIGNQGEMPSDTHDMRIVDSRCFLKFEDGRMGRVVIKSTNLQPGAELTDRAFYVDFVGTTKLGGLQAESQTQSE